jgi:hypothetical protein
MYSTVKRLAAVAAVGVLGILGPVASANAASTPTRASLAFPLEFPGFAPDPLSFIGPSVAGAAVIGPTVYTVGAGNVFVGTTITTSGGGAVVAAGPGG